ncbi:hypothetical protein E5161_00525 [Cohnella pontilimi]|uniref:Uncharacterized protein n=1 Tax=Cohnella pontilimi TaxID=2564100 RepID=A0A4U0FHL5_9BACL|nr:hypothetical protein [Cohnella pontilimi]TJY43924.1 hypothetical protein E5161_00525 [Cohnella pontilimi]
MIKWLNRVNLIWLFVLFLVFHVILYYSLGNDNWFSVALLASLVDTGIAAVLQFVFREEKRGVR